MKHKTSGKKINKTQKGSGKNNKIIEAMNHKDVLGAGAKKRKKLHNSKDKIETVMKEFKRGTLHSGSGSKVSNRKQAIAIALNEARKSGASIAKKPKKPEERLYIGTNGVT